MERNWDLVRKILLKLEAMPNTLSELYPDQITGSDEELTAYHMHLLDQAGLIKARCIRGLDTPLNCVATSLTWDGHEFLDKIRSDTVWNKVKSTAREKGLSLSLDVIKITATAAIKAMLS